MTLGGKRIMMTHGHDYSVKFTLSRLCAEANKKGADIVLFGHTHQRYERYLPAGETEYGVALSKPMYLFNPGSIGGYEASFGCIEIDQSGNVLLSHGNL
jgi:predicted phosphodiesterase